MAGCCGCEVEARRLQARQRRVLWLVLLRLLVLVLLDLLVLVTPLSFLTHANFQIFF